jgi:predicted nucleic acid-binding protein
MFDTGEPTKRVRAQEAVNELGDRIVVSTQVLQEFYWVATRKKMLSPSAARTVVDEFTQGSVVASSPALVLAAIDLSLVMGYTLWEALILQAALEGGCGRVLTEDLQHGQTIRGLRIENPFS